MGSGLGVGSEGAAGEKNMHDAEFTCALFRFIQLTCEGHNLGEQFLEIHHRVFVNVLIIKLFVLNRVAELPSNAGR